MARITLDASKNRLIDLDTPLGKDVLVVESLSGTETLGRMFEYEIFALSSKSNINFDDLLGHHVTIGFELAGGLKAKRRLIDGRVAQIGLVGMTKELFRYRIIARPWTWMLTRTADCKIFQDKTVPEIIEEVFADQPDQDHVLSLSGSYGKREYCVQYRETDFNFISRLMEEEGIYYFFRHEKGKHTMVICDAIGAHKSVGDVAFFPQDRVPREDQEVVREWSVTREIQTGATAMRDYNFEKPSVDLTVTRSQEREHSESAHEVFDYPGEYLEPPEGEHLVRTRLEELQSAHERIEGRGNARTVACGALFTLTGFARGDQNREYLVVAARIEAINNLFESGESGGAEYVCRFALIPAKDAHYRTPRTSPRPIVQGPQTAVVVGPAGEEIFVDKYGRVKLQFHWDRLGANDDKSSCWVRVSQIWAGKNFGWVTLPRIGQEVIVDFLEGDADRPIVTGRVYNAEQMPPWTLPDNKTQSGILTRSSKEGSPSNANEFRFEDKKGSEQVYLHAEKNQDIEVEADETHWVGHDRKKTIDNDENVEVKNNRTEKVGVDETISIGANRTEDVGADETISIGANRAETVGVNETIDIGANRTETVGANESVTVGASRDLTVGASESISIGASRTDNVGASMTQNIGAGLTQTVGGPWNMTAQGPVLITAPAGLTIVSPAGNHTIDSIFDKVGGVIAEFFGVQQTTVNASVSTTGVAVAQTALKMELTGQSVSSTQIVAEEKSLQMAFVGCDMTKVGIKVTLADMKVIT